mgnify:CR=1 FL=1
MTPTQTILDDIQRLEAELLAIDGYYRTAEDLDAKLLKKPVQAWLTDETRIKLNDGPVGEVQAWVQNRTKLHALVDAWLDGVEFKG